MIKSLWKYYKKNFDSFGAGYQATDSVPITFVLDSNFNDQEYKDFAELYRSIAEKKYNQKKYKMPAKHCMNNIWILKPASLNQGRGIEVLRTLSEIEKCITTRDPYSKWIVQKYIEEPLLYKNRKFDIRLQVTVSGEGDVLFYKDGYIRTSSSVYEISREDNFVHLTNSCL